MMKTIFQIIFLCFFGFTSQGQAIRNASDSDPIVKAIDNSASTKQHNISFTNYSLTLVSDSMHNSLLKAVVVDKDSRSTRTYYFQNDYLIKVFEKFDQPNDLESAHSYFLESSYSFGTTYKDGAQPDTRRQRLLSDAYKFLLYHREVSNR